MVLLQKMTVLGFFTGASLTSKRETEQAGVGVMVVCAILF
jgi:hypothetical protein